MTKLTFAKMEQPSMSTACNGTSHLDRIVWFDRWNQRVARQAEEASSNADDASEEVITDDDDTIK
jgi:hypothetical protein